VASKAVVLVGGPNVVPHGSGTGSGALRDVAAAPALVPLGNRPFLFHVLDSLSGGGIEEVTLVADRRDEAAVSAAVTADEWPLRIRCVACEPSAGLADAICGAAGDAVLLHLGDGLAELPLDVRGPEIGALDALLLNENESGAPAGALVLGSSAAVIAADLPPSEGLDAALVALLERMRRLGGTLTQRSSGNWWHCSEGARALLDGNDFVLERLPRAPHGHTGSNQIAGPVQIHPTATVESSVIRGPVIIGERARVRDAYLGPCTSIGPDADVEGAEIEHSIVFAGAFISHLGARLEGSVIGPRARVFRDFRLPRALRLEVGGDAQVALS
jgi:glucose-1-phosphate thymidylyltransferase